MSVKKDQKKDTVRRILDAAAKEFADTGYEGARVDGIAARAGVNKAMIYYHVGDKAELYGRVLGEVFGDLSSRMLESVEAEEAPCDKIRAYVRSLGRAFERHPYLPKIMMREMAGGGKYLPEFVSEDFGKIVRCVAKIIDEGCASGDFVRTDPLVLHLMAAGGLSYLVNTGPVRERHLEAMKEVSAVGSEERPSALAGRIEEIVLRALSAR